MDDYMTLLTAMEYNVHRDCNPGSLSSIPGSGIEEFVIPGFRDPAGIIKWQKYVNTHQKNCRFSLQSHHLSVHLANENNAIETN